MAEAYQDYCLPDKTDLIKPKINELVEEIEKLLVDNSITIITQIKIRKKKPNYIILKEEY